MTLVGERLVEKRRTPGIAITILRRLAILAEARLGRIVEAFLDGSASRLFPKHANVRPWI